MKEYKKGSTVDEALQYSLKRINEYDNNLKNSRSYSRGHGPQEFHWSSFFRALIIVSVGTLISSFLVLLYKNF